MKEGFVSKTLSSESFSKNQRPSLVGQKAHGVRVQLDSTLRNETPCERGLLFTKLLFVVFVVYQKDPERFSSYLQAEESLHPFPLPLRHRKRDYVVVYGRLHHVTVVQSGGSQPLHSLGSLEALQTCVYKPRPTTYKIE